MATLTLPSTTLATETATASMTTMTAATAVTTPTPTGGTSFGTSGGISGGASFGLTVSSRYPGSPMGLPKELTSTPSAPATSPTSSTPTSSTSPTSTTLSTIKVVVVGWRTRTRLGKPFTEYKLAIESGPLGWVAYKRYSEFADLRRQLSSITSLSSLSLPKLPGKKIIGNRKEDFISERRKQLAEWLSGILTTADFAFSAPMLTFLGAMTPMQGSETKDFNHTGVRLHVDRIVDLATPGDVFLFHTDGVLQSMQRTFTKSDYDHVGIVVRVPPHSRSDLSLFILEATSDGVKKYPLRLRLFAWWISKAHISWRRLNLVRNFENMQKLGDFVTEVDGLPYSLTPLKFIRKEKEHHDNYFCSELVAHAYKTMGLLPDTTSSTRYFPVSFSEQKGLQLLADASLDREIVVLFTQPEVVNARTVVTESPSHRVSIDHDDTDDEDDNGDDDEKKMDEKNSNSSKVGPVVSVVTPHTNNDTRTAADSVVDANSASSSNSSHGSGVSSSSSSGGNMSISSIGSPSSLGVSPHIPHGGRSDSTSDASLVANIGSMGIGSTSSSSYVLQSGEDMKSVRIVTIHRNIRSTASSTRTTTAPLSLIVEGASRI